MVRVLAKVFSRIWIVLLCWQCTTGIELDRLADAKDLNQQDLLLLDKHWRYLGNSLTAEIAPGQPANINQSFADHVNQDNPCATFGLELPAQKPHQYALFIRNQFTAYRLYDNGALIAARGKVSCEPGATVGSWGPAVIPLPSHQKEHRLVLQTSQTSFHFGGFRTKTILGDRINLQQIQKTRTFTESLIIGAIIIMGFFNVVFFLSRREDKAALYFSLLCLIAALYASVNGQFLLITIFPILTYNFVGQLIALTIYWLASLFLFFIESNLTRLPQVLRVSMVVSSVLATLLTVFLPPAESALIFTYYRIVLAAFIVYGIAYLARHIKGHTQAILSLYGGILIAIDFFAAQVSYNQPVIYAWRFSGLLVFTLFNSGYLAKRLGDSLSAVTKQEKDLRNQNKIITKNSEELRRANEQKQVLLSEIYHRVKNNLQVILSMIWLPKEIAPEARPLLTDLENRIKTVAQVHEDLFRTDNITDIDLAPYFNQLVNNIVNSLNTGHNVEAAIEVDNVDIDINTAISCGLIVNELVTNAFKYAFTKGQAGIIEISLTQADGKLHLAVSDNGTGIEQPGESKDSSMGMDLIQELSLVFLGSEGSFNFDKGVRFDLYFTPRNQ